MARNRARALHLRLRRLAVVLGLATAVWWAPGIGDVPPASALTYDCGFNAYCATVSEVGAIGGDGRGVITSSYTKTATGTSTRIDCTYANGAETGTCTLVFRWLTAYPTDPIDLTFTPATGSYFCTGYMGTQCVTEGTAKVESLVLNPGDKTGFGGYFWLAKRTLALSKTGDGSGTVTLAPPGGPACATLPCTATYKYGEVVTLSATPDTGAVFTTWTGACSGQQASCTLTMDSAYPTVGVSTNVVFGLPGASQPPTPKPTRTPLPTAAPASRAPTIGPSSPAPPASVEASPVPTTAGGISPAATSSGIPPGLVVLIAVLALLVGGLGVGLIVALRRRPG